MEAIVKIVKVTEIRDHTLRGLAKSAIGILYQSMHSMMCGKCLDFQMCSCFLNKVTKDKQDLNKGNMD